MCLFGSGLGLGGLVRRLPVTLVSCRDSRLKNPKLAVPEGPYILPLWNQVPKTITGMVFYVPNPIVVVHMDPLAVEVLALFVGCAPHRLLEHLWDTFAVLGLSGMARFRA